MDRAGSDATREAKALVPAELPSCDPVEKAQVPAGSQGRRGMKWLLALTLFAALLGAGEINAADECGPGCHNAVNGGCVVNGWESGAVAWNECPAFSHPRPRCAAPYVWRKYAKACVHTD